MIEQNTHNTAINTLSVSENLIRNMDINQQILNYYQAQENAAYTAYMPAMESDIFFAGANTFMLCVLPIISSIVGIGLGFIILRAMRSAFE